MGCPFFIVLPVTAGLFFLAPFCSMPWFWFIIGVIVRIKAVFLTDCDAVARAARNIARRSIELAGQLFDAMDGTTLSGDRLAHFSIIAIHLNFTSSCSRLGSQPRDDNIGCFAMARVNDANTTVVTNLFAGAIAVKDKEDVMWRVAIAIHQLSDEGVTSCCEVSHFHDLECGTIFDDIVAIDKDISAHNLLPGFCFIVLLNTYSMTIS